MKLLSLGSLLFLFLGCDSSGNGQAPAPAPVFRLMAEDDDYPYARVFHDDKRGVTCWSFSSTYARSVSCLPDSQLVGAP